jgi:hypothetical protein
MQKNLIILITFLMIQDVHTAQRMKSFMRNHGKLLFGIPLVIYSDDVKTRRTFCARSFIATAGNTYYQSHGVPVIDKTSIIQCVHHEKLTIDIVEKAMLLGDYEIIARVLASDRQDLIDTILNDRSTFTCNSWASEGLITFGDCVKCFPSIQREIDKYKKQKDIANGCAEGSL